ncbi:hypothetical protein BC829DRAFT_416451 [Chytridium lagenaria]|nr:hypothetical protein BC829DRAFT_416451 [Chytridium lagenaria]
MAMAFLTLSPLLSLLMLQISFCNSCSRHSRQSHDGVAIPVYLCKDIPEDAPLSDGCMRCHAGAGWCGQRGERRRAAAAAFYALTEEGEDVLRPTDVARSNVEETSADSALTSATSLPSNQATINVPTTFTTISPIALESPQATVTAVPGFFFPLAASVTDTSIGRGMATTQISPPPGPPGNNFAPTLSNAPIVSPSATNSPGGLAPTGGGDGSGRKEGMDVRVVSGVASLSKNSTIQRPTAAARPALKVTTNPIHRSDSISTLVGVSTSSRLIRADSIETIIPHT